MSINYTLGWLPTYNYASMGDMVLNRTMNAFAYASHSAKLVRGFSSIRLPLEYVDILSACMKWILQFEDNPKMNKSMTNVIKRTMQLLVKLYIKMSDRA